MVVKFLKVVVVMVSLSISTLAWSHAYETGRITRIIAEGSNVVSVFLDGSDNTSYCSKGWRWTLYTTDAMFESKYSLLLAMAAQNKPIKLMHHSTSSCGGWESNRIYYIDADF